MKKHEDQLSRFLIKVGNSPTSWYSKLQHFVSTSTAEFEYYALNNKAAIYNSQNQTFNPKNKHIDVRYHFITELI
ncbi:hypothetical protein PIROE2DRAFT_2274 [Piromyces sp. E2]|nr:hypothetical protein PIROE2DRAFT_2274 [Piromyces sp. E2]|eukprot:OUM69840.1 hypothetical protein PIROE2DRAFT_2274 [Piromyces sp. E2]